MLAFVMTRPSRAVMFINKEFTSYVTNMCKQVGKRKLQGTSRGSQALPLGHALVLGYQSFAAGLSM